MSGLLERAMSDDPEARKSLSSYAFPKRLEAWSTHKLFLLYSQKGQILPQPCTAGMVTQWA